MGGFTNNMNEFNKRTSNSRDRFSGGIKKATGKLTGNEQLELKGRIQIAKANFKDSISVKNNVDDAKESIAKKINDRLDKKKK